MECKDGGQEQGQEGADKGTQGTRVKSIWKHEDLEATQLGQEEIIALSSRHTSNTEASWQLCRKLKGEGGAKRFLPIPPPADTSDIDTLLYLPTAK